MDDSEDTRGAETEVAENTSDDDDDHVPDSSRQITHTQQIGGKNYKVSLQLPKHSNNKKPKTVS